MPPMINHRPLMLLRARPHNEALPRFADWFRQVHLNDVQRIPGIFEARTARTAGGTWLGLYTFESGEALQGALASPEAAYARGTWEQWAPHLEDLTIEMFAPVAVPRVYPVTN
jgi:hypothetical protein